MKLKIKRNQATGFFGGVKFELGARVELTEEEAQLVKKYKADGEVLLSEPVKHPLLKVTVSFEPITIASLISGKTFKAKNIMEVLEYEENLKKADRKSVV